jgi:hypothetical protein
VAAPTTANGTPIDQYTDAFAIPAATSSDRSVVPDRAIRPYDPIIMSRLVAMRPAPLMQPATPAASKIMAIRRSQWWLPGVPGVCDVSQSFLSLSIFAEDAERGNETILSNDQWQETQGCQGGEPKKQVPRQL